MLKKVWFFLFIFCLGVGYDVQAQFTDEFSDGDFISNPTWVGQTSNFIVSSEQLALNAPATDGTSYLSTASSVLDSIQWTILVEMSFNPSGTSFADVFIASDQEDVSGDLNGYFIRIGDTEDEISLYRKDGDVETKIIDGPDDRVDQSSVSVTVRVTRDNSGNWTLLSDVGSTGSFIEEGSTNDVTHTTTTFFGIRCTYIASRSTAFTFDNISVIDLPQDIVAPILTEVSVLDDDSLTLTFSEALATIPAETPSNYSVNNGIGNPSNAGVLPGEPNKVGLKFSTSFSDGVENTISVTNVEDLEGNAIPSGTPETAAFTYIAPVLANPREVVINEWMADPPDGSAEFIELFNATTDKTFNLAGWTIADGSGSDPIPTGSIAPGAFIILCDDSDVALFEPFGTVIAIESFNALNNSADQIVLKDENGVTIDSTGYDTFTPESSTEQINPFLLCPTPENYVDRTSGFSPGTQNAAFDDTPDTTPPIATEALATGENMVRVFFNEKMDQASLEMSSSFTVDNGISVTASNAILPELVSTDLTVSSLTPEVNYTLMVGSVTDCAGNPVLPTNLMFLRDITAPLAVRVALKDEENLAVVFNEAINPDILSTGDFSIDNGINNPSEVAISESDDQVVNLELGSKLALGTTYRIDISNIQDLAANTISDTSLSFTFSDAIDTVLVLGDNLLDVLFEEEVSEGSLASLSNFSVNRDIGDPIAATRDDANERLVHLIFAVPFVSSSSSAVEHVLTITNIQNTSGDFLNTPDQTFFVDKDVPGFDDLQVVDSVSLRLFFDERLQRTASEAITNYEVDFELGNPASASLESGDTSVFLVFADRFQPELTYRITIRNLTDISGNTRSSNISENFSFDDRPPILVDLKTLGDQQIGLIFNEPLETNSAREVLNYELNNGAGNPLSAEFLVYDSSQVRLLFAAPFEERDDYTLEVRNLRDRVGNILSEDQSIAFSTILPTLSIAEIITEDSVRLVFSESINVDDRTDETLYLLGDSPVAEAVGIPDSGNLVDLLLPTTLTEEAIQSLRINSIRDQSGNQTQNIQADLFYNDGIMAAFTVSNNSLVIRFDQAMERESVELESNYRASNGLGLPVAAVYSESDDDEFQVTLFFNESFEAATDYQLIVRNIRDSQLRPVSGSVQNFTFDGSAPGIESVEALFKDRLIITLTERLDA
jgi:hypothetical protein